MKKINKTYLLILGIIIGAALMYAAPKVQAKIKQTKEKAQ